MKSTTLFSFFFFFMWTKRHKNLCVLTKTIGGRGFSTIIPPPPKNFWGQILEEENLPLKLNVVLVMGKKEIQEQNRVFFHFYTKFKILNFSGKLRKKKGFSFSFFFLTDLFLLKIKKRAMNRVVNVWTQKQAKIENFVSLCSLKDPW